MAPLTPEAENSREFVLRGFANIVRAAVVKEIRQDAAELASQQLLPDPHEYLVE